MLVWYKILAVIFWMMIMPLAVGGVIQKKEDGNVIRMFMKGLMIGLSIFEIIAVSAVFLHQSLKRLTFAWAIFMIILALAGIWRTRLFYNQRKWIKTLICRGNLLFLVALLGIGMQMTFVSVEQHVDADDAFYVATATTSVETNTLYRYNSYTGRKSSNYYKRSKRYVMSAWPLYLAVMSKLSDIHPAILAHTVMPAILILWAYLAYLLIGSLFFPGERRKQAIFWIITVILMTFGGDSIYSSITFLFIRTWQGKALLAGMGLPFVFYLSCRTIQKNAEYLDWLELGMAETTCCMFSSMGVVLAPMTMGICLLSSLIRDRDFSYLWKCILVCIVPLICGLVYLIL